LQIQTKVMTSQYTPLLEMLAAHKKSSHSYGIGSFVTDSQKKALSPS